MNENSSSKKWGGSRFLYRIALLPIIWIIFAIIIPSFILGILKWRAVLFETSAEGIGVILLCGVIAYLLVQIRKERWLVRVVLSSMGFMLLSVLLRLARQYHAFDDSISANLRDVLQQAEASFNGLGITIIIFAFLWAIIDLLDTRNLLIEEQVRLSQEMAERKKVEEALRNSEEAIRFMIGTVHDVFWQMTPELRFTYISPAVTRQQGYAPDDVIGHSLLEFLTKTSAKTLSELYAQRSGIAKQEDVSNYVTYEFELRRKDGSFMWCEAIPSPIHDPTGSIIGFQGVTRDITRRKRAEDALRDSEEKYRELVENANSIILRMDRNGNINFFNEFAQRFFGFDECEILGKSVIGTIVSDKSAQGDTWTAMIHGIIDNPAVYVNSENENTRKNGETVWIAWTNKPIVDHAGNLREILCVGNDITARVRAEKLLAEQRVKMIENARLVSLGIMAGGIAHEINNPLAVIAGCAEQLETYTGPVPAKDDVAHKLLRMIRGNTDRIQKTIQGLRFLSRDASQDAFVKSSIVGIIGNTVELCHERFRMNNIHIEIETTGHAVEIECRPSQISQVLLNLLNNAFDAVKNLPEKRIKITTADRGDWVEIAIEDSGPGIPKEIADRLFVPFFTTKSEQHGLGLGLSISHAIVDTHNGEIAVDTSCNHTRFIVRLPKTPGDGRLSLGQGHGVAEKVERSNVVFL